MLVSIDNKVKFKVAAMHSVKVFALNLLVGWVVMLFLLFGFAYQSELFFTNSFADLWNETAFSFMSLTLPVFVSTTVAMIKFNSIFFGCKKV